MPHPERVAVARAVILLGNKLLVCQGKGETFCHLPGGHIEAGEIPGNTLRRELLEELGRPVQDAVFLGEFDNVYQWTGDGKEHGIHEHNYLFKVKLYPVLQEMAPRSPEKHLRLKWIDLQDMQKEQLLPPLVHDWIRRYAI